MTSHNSHSENNSLQNNMRLYEIIKRIFDVAFSLLALVFMLPLLIIIAFAIKFESPGPLLYRQIRIGKNHKQFSFYKFRTMRIYIDSIKYHEFLEALIKSSTDSNFDVKTLTRNDIRVTRVVRFLRKYSMDELPIFICI